MSKKKLPKYLNIPPTSKYLKSCIKDLNRYYPVTPSEIPAYGELSMVRFSSIITGFDFKSDRKNSTYWYFGSNKPRIIAWLDLEMEDLSEAVIHDTLSVTEHGRESIEFFRFTDWRGDVVTVYGMVIEIDERKNLIYVQAHCILPQEVQTELARKSVTPTKKLVVGKLTEQVTNDFEQRKKQIAKLLRQRKI